MGIQRITLFSHLEGCKGQVQADCNRCCLGSLAAPCYDGRIYFVFWQAGKNAFRWNTISVVQFCGTVTLAAFFPYHCGIHQESGY